MTAILKDLRSLRAARDRGEITSAQFARAEAVLLGVVEDAVLDEGTVGSAPPPHPTPASRRPPPDPAAARATPGAPRASARIWETGLMIAAGLASFTLLLAVLIGSLTLALTLLVTIIAAGSVHAVKSLDK